MSSLSESRSRDERIIHRIVHEIEEQVDVSADKVAEIIELWEVAKRQRGLKDKEVKG